jgi:hypothetical protein
VRRRSSELLDLLLDELQGELLVKKASIEGSVLGDLATGEEPEGAQSVLCRKNGTGAGITEV